MTHSETIELEPLDKIIDEFNGRQGTLIPILQKTQDLYGYLPSEALGRIAEKTGTPLSQIYGVATFYSQFYLTRRGKTIIRQCDGTACHVRGAGRIVDTIQNELGIQAGETTPDYQYTFEVVYCLGACGLAPVAVVDNKVVGRLVPEKMAQILKET
ncbi:MAG: NADH-quinone oxidoreductase subunit NuoE [Deltaproteobacteria bacterium]|nr:NADH-quinone oxidoreductase subunit NuoE [Deltaproteobacteria bacterium]